MSDKAVRLPPWEAFAWLAAFFAGAAVARAAAVSFVCPGSTIEFRSLLASVPAFAIWSLPILLATFWPGLKVAFAVTLATGLIVLLAAPHLMWSPYTTRSYDQLPTPITVVGYLGLSVALVSALRSPKWRPLAGLLWVGFAAFVGLRVFPYFKSEWGGFSYEPVQVELKDPLDEQIGVLILIDGRDVDIARDGSGLLLVGDVLGAWRAGIEDEIRGRRYLRVPRERLVSVTSLSR